MRKCHKWTLEEDIICAKVVFDNLNTKKNNDDLVMIILRDNPNWIIHHNVTKMRISNVIAVLNDYNIDYSLNVGSLSNYARQTYEAVKMIFNL